MNVLLGVGGGIAAYKAPEIVRALRREGHDVRVVMTQAAAAFVTGQTLATLSGHPVRSALFDPAAESAMSHIELARWADAVLIAPATADLMARLAQGHADDLLTTLVLATRAPVWLAPAMNHQMWAHPATQRNRQRLLDDGLRLIGPAEGEQACGEVGPGRMVEPDELVQALARDVVRDGVRDSLAMGVRWPGAESVGAPAALKGRRVVITAGGTREAVDPVRYIGNRSSGKMGVALARAARAAGAEVTLVHAPLAVALPDGVRTLAVESAAEMAEAVRHRLDTMDVFIGAAAVADFRPVQVAPQKLKKLAGPPRLMLEPTEDIVAMVARASPRPFVIGFAAETDDIERHARDKLERKKLDWVVANDVSGGRGFGADTNAVTVHRAGADPVRFDEQPKPALAQALIALLGEALAARDAATRSLHA